MRTHNPAARAGNAKEILRRALVKNQQKQQDGNGCAMHGKHFFYVYTEFTVDCVTRPRSCCYRKVYLFIL